MSANSGRLSLRTGRSRKGTSNTPMGQRRRRWILGNGEPTKTIFWVSTRSGLVQFFKRYLFAGYPKLAIMPMDFMVCMMMTSNYMDYTGLGISTSKGECFRTKQNMCDNVLQPENMGITAHLCHGDQHQGGAPVPMPSPSPRGSSCFGLGFWCLSPFFSLLLSFLNRSVPDSSMNFELHMTLVETCLVAVWGLCWCNFVRNQAGPNQIIPIKLGSKTFPEISCWMFKQQSWEKLEHNHS